MHMVGMLEVVCGGAVVALGAASGGVVVGAVVCGASACIGEGDVAEAFFGPWGDGELQGVVEQVDAGGVGCACWGDP